MVSVSSGNSHYFEPPGMNIQIVVARLIAVFLVKVWSLFEYRYLIDQFRSSSECWSIV